MFDWVQKLESNTAVCIILFILGLIVFSYRTQIKSIIAFDPVHFTEQ